MKRSTVAVGVSAGIALAFVANAASASEGRTGPRRPRTKSPFPGVTGEQWRRFLVTLMDSSNKVSITGHYGVFHFSATRLRDLGIMTDVHKASSEGGKSIWVGTFIPPMTTEIFVNTMDIQLKALERSMFLYLAKVPKGVIGREIEGRKATLSGLLAVAHRAGGKGLLSWLSDPKDRTRYPNTSKAYAAANGIF